MAPGSFRISVVGYFRGGNLGWQPETREGERLGGCLGKQGVGGYRPTHGLLAVGF